MDAEKSEKLYRKILTLNQTIWGKRSSFRASIDTWLANFNAPNPPRDEKLHALYLLSKFMYFGEPQIREMLKVVYRDLYKYPLIHKIRKENGNTRNIDLIASKFKSELENTRFLGLGNPSESGVFLLYYFRQENCLSKGQFIHSYEIFTKDNKIKNPSVRHYIFLDDLCSSGSQATSYSKDIVERLKKLDPTVDVQYLTLIGLADGISRTRRNTKYDNIATVFTLDNSFKCFSDLSRYFIVDDPEIKKDFAKAMCESYGKKLRSDHPLGWQSNQLLLGFHHNIPDNTLPIIWCERNDSAIKWRAIFKRFEKRY